VSKAGIGVLQATMLVAGNVVGVGILLTPGAVLSNAGSASAALLTWSLGGVMALLGGLATAECAARYPRNGGDYVYISEGIGRPVGFLSGWASTTAGFPGSLATMSAALVLTVLPGREELAPWLGAGVLVATTVIVLGPIRVGATLNAAASVANLVLLLSVIVLAALAPAAAAAPEVEGPLDPAGIGRGLVSVFFAYSGWNVVSYIAAECKEPGRTVPLSMMLGISGVAVLYVLFSHAVVGAAGAQAFSAGPEAVIAALDRLLGPVGAVLGRGVLVAGIVTTLLSTALAGPRITAEMAKRGDLPKSLGKRWERTGAPTWATLLQGALAAGLVLTGTFEQLLTWTTSVMLLFGALTAAVQVVLRLRDRKDAGIGAHFKDPIFPLAALGYGGMCLWVLVQVARGSDPLQSLSGVLLVLLGLPVFAWMRR
jgi:basic amino acid/polyamine antiporter, APA family